MNPQPRHSHSHFSSLAGSTPSFELSQDPLSSDSNQSSTSPTGHSNSNSNRSRPSPINTSAAATPIDPYEPSATPTPTSATASNVKRRSHHATGPAAVRGREDDSKRPTSPHITTATPTSARHPHAHFAPSPSNSRTPPPNVSNVSSSAGNHPQRQSSLGRAAQKFIEAFGSEGPQNADLEDEDDDERFKGHPTRSGSGSGRFTPTNWFGSSGPTTGGRRKSEGGVFTGRFFSEDQNQNQGSGFLHRDPEEIIGEEGEGEISMNASRESILEDLDGNEILSSPKRFLGNKGKEKERSKSNPRFNSNGFLEKDRSPIFDEYQEEEEISLNDEREKERRKDRRKSNLSFSGRKTPKVYRPLDETSNQDSSLQTRNNGMMNNQSHIQRAAGSKSMDRSESEISIAMDTSMRLATPQARRGAINLNNNSYSKSKSKRKRLRKRRNLKRNKAPQPTFSQDLKSFFHLIKSFLLLFLSPKKTFFSLIESIGSFFRALDDSFRDPITKRRIYKPTWFEAYVPLLIWLVISLSSTVIVLTFHNQVFGFLDRLAKDLREAGLTGRFILGGLIFLTTFPPLPLYSTLIILCGFSFGLVQGFIISYIAALSGAITVFVLSRSFLKEWMVGLLNKSGGLKKVVRAIEKQPKLLFLVRLAPYPYNLMNTLLASSPTLSLKTYTLCTALALPKLLVHTGLGTSIQNFAAYHGAASTSTNNNSTIIPGEGTGNSTANGEVQPVDSEATAKAERIKQIAGFVGVGLCIGIFLYLLVVARRAVDELDDEDGDLESSIELDRNGNPNEGFEEEVKRRNERIKRKGDYFAVHGKDEDDDDEEDEDEDELEAEKYGIDDEEDSDFDGEEELLSENENFKNFNPSQNFNHNQHLQTSSSSSNPLNISSQTLIDPSSSSTLNLSMHGNDGNQYGHRFSGSTTSNQSKDEISLADKIAQMESSAENYDTGRHRSGSEAAKRGLTGYEGIGVDGGWR